MEDKSSKSSNPFFRPLRVEWLRSPYAVEGNPWATTQDVEAAIFFRGAIVSAHGYVETRIAELCFRCSKLPQYADLRSSFPYSLGDRLSFLRKAFSAPPLHIYQETAERFFINVEQGAELRHIVAHARMQVMPNWGVTFHDFRTSKGGLTDYRQHRRTLSELEREAWNAARLSRKCHRLATALESLALLPPLEANHDQ
jgi:hypothetical protein